MTVLSTLGTVVSGRVSNLQQEPSQVVVHVVSNEETCKLRENCLITSLTLSVGQEVTYF